MRAGNTAATGAASHLCSPAGELEQASGNAPATTAATQQTPEILDDQSV
jgi:hypothetical protein